MRDVRCLLVLAILSLAPGRDLPGQVPATADIRVLEDTTLVQEVSLRDGTRLVGRIVRVAGDEVTVRTTGGLEIALQRRDIVKVRQVFGRLRNGELWEDDPSDSRLFLGPTARVPPNGHGYIGVYELIFASGGVGIGGMGMLSGGFSMVPGVPIDEQVFYVAPKLQFFNVPGLAAAGGAFWIKPGSSNESAGLVYGTMTAGVPDAALTFSVSFPFATRGGFEDQPLLMVGGDLRVHQNLKVMTENWVVPGEDVTLTSFGVRLITRLVTVEAAAVLDADGGGFLPLVSFSLVW